jgi:hypothetical protein
VNANSFLSAATAGNVSFSIDVGLFSILPKTSGLRQ